MVTTRKTSDSKVIAMDEKAGGAVAPPKTLLEEVNSQLMCVLCQGYYIDATTIVECLHSFCRSCIIKHLQVKSYCPICEMMINSAKPNIKPDKALQDIVYKLVPGLFQREMQRRQAFYASRPGPAASATPEQRGEDTERIIFSPEDVISFSLEYMDCTETESASSRSSESGNESTPCNEGGAPTRRYLQCPAVVNISHLKKFLSMKYDVDATHFFVDILYKRVPLPDYYTLMDIAYIYNWKRNEPMRFFYQISDFSAIRDRFGFFGLSRAGTLLGRKGVGGASPAPASPATSQLTEGGSDASSGSFSPLPHDKAHSDFAPDRDNDSKSDIHNRGANDCSSRDSSIPDSQTSPQSSSSMDVEKSQFLNSFELTAKCSVGSGKCPESPSKDQGDKSSGTGDSCSPTLRDSLAGSKSELQPSPGKRKSSSPPEVAADGKKVKLSPVKPQGKSSAPSEISPKELRSAESSSYQSKNPPSQSSSPKSGSNVPKTVPRSTAAVDQQKSEEKGVKPTPKVTYSSLNSTITVLAPQSLVPATKSSPVKRKLSGDRPIESQLVGQSKNILSASNPDHPKISTHTTPQLKRIDNKDRVVLPTNAPPKPPETPKVNIPHKLPSKPENSLKPPEPRKGMQKPLIPPTPRPPLRMQAPKAVKPRGDPLKSLFDSCNINIPSSLSITLTDQKLDQKPEDGNERPDGSKSISNVPATSSNQAQTASQQKNNSAQIHNYIEIVKLPESESIPSKDTEEKNSKCGVTAKSTADGSVSTKGPVPNLKPISDTKQSKNVPITKPQTFQQTFLQSLQQQSEKPKYIKTVLDFKNLPRPPIKEDTESVPATSKPAAVSAPVATSTPATVKYTKPVTASTPAPKYKPVPMAQPISKAPPSTLVKTIKPDSALDLSTPHIGQSQLGPQQTKALETMQSIANLAKRQSYNQRMTSPSQVFSQESFKMNTSNPSPIRIPVPPIHTKHLKSTNSTQASSVNSPKHFSDYYQSVKSTPSRTSNNGSPIQNIKSSNPLPSASYTERSQTRSPSSSPKLVIACPSPKSQSPEEKQLLSPRGVDTSSQSSLISSSQITSTNHTNSESVTAKEIPKALPKSQTTGTKGNGGVRTSSSTKAGTSGNGNIHTAQVEQQILAQQTFLRQQLELQTQLGLLPPGTAAQWYNNPVARAHFENIMKNMTHNSQMSYSNNHKDNN